jgi:hypothetical protein
VSRDESVFTVLKIGLRNIQEYSGIFRNIPEYSEYSASLCSLAGQAGRKIGLSYRPARLYRLKDRFLVSLNVYKFGLRSATNLATHFSNATHLFCRIIRNVYLFFGPSNGVQEKLNKWSNSSPRLTITPTRHCWEICPGPKTRPKVKTKKCQYN